MSWNFYNKGFRGSREINTVYYDSDLITIDEMEDAVSAYRWLLDTGLAGGNICLSGDSAGGGLSIATSISLRDAGEPSRASIACISPWTDLKMSGHSIKAHAEIDPIFS